MRQQLAQSIVSCQEILSTIATNSIQQLQSVARSSNNANSSNSAGVLLAQVMETLDYLLDISACLVLLLSSNHKFSIDTAKRCSLLDTIALDISACLVLLLSSNHKFSIDTAKRCSLLDTIAHQFDIVLCRFHTWAHQQQTIPSHLDTLIESIRKHMLYAAYQILDQGYFQPLRTKHSNNAVETLVQRIQLLSTASQRVEDELLSSSSSGLCSPLRGDDDDQPPGETVSLLHQLEQHYHLYDLCTDIFSTTTNTASDYVLSMLRSLRASAQQPSNDVPSDLIAQVKEVFPDFHDAFVSALFQQMDTKDPAIVIHRVLEGSLPEKLASLDKTKPPPSSSSSTDTSKKQLPLFKGCLFALGQVGSSWDERTAIEKLLEKEGATIVFSIDDKTTFLITTPSDWSNPLSDKKDLYEIAKQTKTTVLSAGFIEA
eukprot:CAMPEP_0201561666 /NCGR_PEP_ID=MMETSP0173_2-20130828/78917_1 /ASSEMBLY_ACC=CAM_ASM_000268 /TAXON_ID=218659 /ORGANISM="Vexillifera sp., Strain DIVA3 564/2" /LENGTH=428 /DNA_ID=CAMNT_0047976181 /DNA_START=288 /DNA_END=1571 /DNA_ORIENTATION=+